tara:strand:+ start:85 stop:576 length:492 start_codon:yes stop_codon:yes gene_type:complete
MNKNSIEKNTVETQQKRKPWIKAILIGIIVWWLSAYMLAMEGQHGDGSLSYEKFFLSILISFIAVYIVANGAKETIIKATTAAKKTSRVAEEIDKESDIRVGVRREIKTEEDAYQIAAEELEEEVQNKGIWAKAFSDANGDEKKQKALYIKYRAQQLIKNIIP